MLDKIAAFITILQAAQLAASQFGRTEAVMRVLQELGLPVRPPTDDFETLYLYTLIHYGVDKPQQLVELFRAPELIEAFREAHVTGDLSKVVAEAVVAVSALAIGDDLLRLAPDLQAETREFGAQFERFVDRGRRPDTARLEGKVDALLAAQSFDPDELRRLRTDKWKARLDETAQIANAGLYTQARSMAEAILKEMAQEGPDRAPQDSRAAAHVMLAQLALVVHEPHMASQAQQHLDDARALHPQSAESPTARRITALLALRDDPLRAVEQLSDLTDKDSLLELFLTYLNMADFAACDRMLHDGSIDLSRSSSDSDMARTAALYHGSLGHAASLSEACRVLLHDRNGRNLHIAALACERAAMHRYGQLCRDYEMPPVPVFIDVPDLMDRAAYSSALAYLVEAAEWFGQKDAPFEASEAAEGAMRIAVRLDQRETAASMMRLLKQPSLAGAMAATLWHDDSRFAPAAISLQRLDELVVSYGIEPGPALELAMATAVRDQQLIPQVLTLLASRRGFFTDSTEVLLTCARDVVTLMSLSEATHLPLDPELATYGAHVFDEVNLPSKFAWYPEIVECRKLLREPELPGPTLDRATKAVELARALSIAGNPEVLWAAVLVAQNKDDWEASLSAARALVASARTNSSVVAYLTSVFKVDGPDSFVEELNTAIAAGLPEDEFWTRINRANALLATRRDEAAVPDLEWVLTDAEGSGDRTRQAVSQAAMDLARIHRICGRYPEAVGVLERADRLWGQTDYLFVTMKADTLLVSGDGEGAYRTLAEAVPRFAGTPAFDVMLLHTGFGTGNDNRPEVRDAFSRIAANPDGEMVRRVEVPLGEGLGEFGEMLTQRLETAEKAHTMYRNGWLPFVALCCAPAVNQSICARWWGMGYQRILRYVSIGLEGAEVDWLRQAQPDAAVLDYTSLLLLDEILPASHGDAISFALQCFPKVYLPTSLRSLLDWEAQKLLPAQPSEDRVAANVLDSQSGSGKLNEIPGDFSMEDLSGTLAASHFAAQKGLPCVAAYVDHYPGTEVPLVPLIDLIDHLAQLGALDMLSFAEMRGLFPPAGTPPAWDWQRLDNEREFAIDVEALQALSRHRLLNDVLAWSRRVFVPAAGLLRLRGRVAYMHDLEGTRERFRRLRAALSQANDHLEWMSIGPLERQVEFPHQGGGTWDLAFDYFADLFNVAHKVGAPIWTDDRATRAAALTPAPIERVGTYAVLLRARELGLLSEEDWMGMAQRITESGVLSLGVDAHYLLRLIRPEDDQ